MNMMERCSWLEESPAIAHCFQLVLCVKEPLHTRESRGARALRPRAGRDKDAESLSRSPQHFFPSFPSPSHISSAARPQETCKHAEQGPCRVPTAPWRRNDARGARDQLKELMRNSSFSRVPEDNHGQSYSYSGSGTNSQGNHFCSRDYGNGSNSYHCAWAVANCIRQAVLASWEGAS